MSPRADHAPAREERELPCRSCSAPLRETFVDLGSSPLCQRHLHEDELALPEPWYPLHVRVCEHCLLVQLPEIVPPEELFGGDRYAYFSSYSESWLVHALRYCEEVSRRFGLGPGSQVIEIASNDGYLLQNFVRAGIPALGIEPAGNTAAEARRRGVETIVRFFGADLARDIAASRPPADLLIANNVLAHVPDLHDFVSGLALLLAPGGVLTLEFPHLVRLIERNQFDTIYHEHFSYFSLLSAETVLRAHGLGVFDAEELDSHGGSLRLYVQRVVSGGRAPDDRVQRLREREAELGVGGLDYYRGFETRVRETKRRLLEFLAEARGAGRTVAAYGAPGKGNTLLNYCGIGTDLIDYTVDRSPHKQGGYLPGSRIPIRAPSEIERTRPDFVLILPWNLREEIEEQMACVREWGGRFVVPIPELRVS